MVPTCQFCGGLGGLLCDGKMPDGSTCDKQMCRRCAKNEFHAIARTNKGCRTVTLDLCPSCVEVGRKVAAK